MNWTKELFQLYTGATTVYSLLAEGCPWLLRDTLVLQLSELQGAATLGWRSGEMLSMKEESCQYRESHLTAAGRRGLRLYQYVAHKSSFKSYKDKTTLKAKGKL